MNGQAARLPSCSLPRTGGAAQRELDGAKPPEKRRGGIQLNLQNNPFAALAPSFAGEELVHGSYSRVTQ
jgi:hypothetical protein